MGDPCRLRSLAVCVSLWPGLFCLSASLHFVSFSQGGLWPCRNTVCSSKRSALKVCEWLQTLIQLSTALLPPRFARCRVKRLCLWIKKYHPISPLGTMMLSPFCFILRQLLRVTLGVCVTVGIIVVRKFICIYAWGGCFLSEVTYSAFKIYILLVIILYMVFIKDVQRKGLNFQDFHL